MKIPFQNHEPDNHNTGCVVQTSKEKNPFPEFRTSHLDACTSIEHARLSHAEITFSDVTRTVSQVQAQILHQCLISSIKGAWARERKMNPLHPCGSHIRVILKVRKKTASEPS